MSPLSSSLYLLNGLLKLYLPHVGHLVGRHIFELPGDIEVAIEIVDKSLILLMSAGHKFIGGRNKRAFVGTYRTIRRVTER